MSTLIDSPEHTAGQIEITISSGKVLRFPVSKNPRLKSASHADLNDIEISPFGLHWPKLDEDLSIRGILDGCYS